MVQSTPTFTPSFRSGIEAASAAGTVQEGAESGCKDSAEAVNASEGARLPTNLMQFE